MYLVISNGILFGHLRQILHFPFLAMCTTLIGFDT